ncbi:Methyltransferase domain protein [uncultured archaeon]|nr:Methyltransferase domain protein [uncultured archaeon]
MGVALGKRYEYDGKPTMAMNKVQLETKKAIDRKIASGHYAFEEVGCAVCGSCEFEKLAEKERYGLFMPVAICRKCGLVQTNPRMDKQSYSEFYRCEYRKLHNAAEHPTEEFFQSQRERGKEIYNFIAKAIGQEPRGKLVAEIGVGAGGILQYFKEMGNEVLGFDFDEEYIGYGKKMGLSLEIGGIEKLVAAGKKADIIIYCHVFEHLLDPVSELEKISSCLGAGGVLFIEVPTIKGIHSVYNSDFLQYLNNAHTYHFTMETLDNCMKKGGFEIIYGTDSGVAVFRAGKKTEGHANEYGKTIAFLKSAENSRAALINFPVVKLRIFRAISTIISSAGLTAAAKKIRVKLTGK